MWYLTRGNLALGRGRERWSTLALILAAMPLARCQIAAWLAWGVGTFVVGWVDPVRRPLLRGQESRPSSTTFVGLLVGPMFVTGEALFALGWGKTLLAEIERRVGPTHLRDLHTPAMR